jgi:ABC-type amino acid transport substrate-binding protein
VGDIDAVIASKPRALRFVKIPANNLKIVGDEFTNEDYGIVVCNKQSGLLSKVNAGLKGVKTNGAMDNLLKKWSIQAVK